MTIDVSRAPLDEIRALRELRRRELNCQIILDSWPERGWTNSFVLRTDGRIVGYASVGGEQKDLVTEFYVVPAERAAAQPLFRRLVDVSGARSIECQSNDRLLTLMLYDFATAIESHVLLFEDGLTTQLPAPSPITLRRATEADRERIARDDGDVDANWLLEADADGAIVATGGLLFHYNVPYGDLYTRVGERFRRRGYGSYLIQELKRIAYESGKVPAARCNAANTASRATLQKAGMLPCARMLAGAITLPST